MSFAISKMEKKSFSKTSEFSQIKILLLIALLDKVQASDLGWMILHVLVSFYIFFLLFFNLPIIFRKISVS